MHLKLMSSLHREATMHDDEFSKQLILQRAELNDLKTTKLDSCSAVLSH